MRNENNALKEQVKHLKDDLEIPCSHCDYYTELVRSMIRIGRAGLPAQRLDWRMHLTDYIAGFKTDIPGKKERSYSYYTSKNYRSWLSKWVAWMEAR